MRTIVAALSILLCAACRSAGGADGSVRVEPVVPAGPLVVHPVYQAAFEALRASLDDDNLAVGRATLARLVYRLEGDRASLPTIARAKVGEDALSQQIMSGEMPSREHAEAALRMAENFGRVLEGRERLRALELTIELERLPDSEICRASLVANSSWPAPLVLRPGPATLDVLRTSLEPRTGVERRDSSKTHLDTEISLEIPARSRTSIPLADIPIQVPIGAIATRLWVDVTFTGGTVSEGKGSFPARDIDARDGERTDLASWVPAVLVGPEELVRAWQRPDASLASLLERTVRIAPARYDETLDLVGIAAETVPAEALQALVPSLRWIVRTNTFGRDELAWRRWLLARLEERRQAGTVFGE